MKKIIALNIVLLLAFGDWISQIKKGLRKSHRMMLLILILAATPMLAQKNIDLEKPASLDQAKSKFKNYSATVQLNLGYVLGVSYEHVVLKRNALTFGVGYNRLNLITRSREIGQNSYNISVPKGQIVDVNNMDNLKGYEYLENGTIYDHWFKRISMDQSFTLIYSDFLPRYAIPINADFRSYFWIKPSVRARPFCEAGLSLNAISGCQITTETSILHRFNRDEFSEDGYSMEEHIYLGKKETRWEPDYHLGLGLRIRVKSRFFIEMKLSRLQTEKFQKRASWTKATQEIADRPFTNFSLGIGTIL